MIASNNFTKKLLLFDYETLLYFSALYLTLKFCADLKEYSYEKILHKYPLIAKL